MMMLLVQASVGSLEPAISRLIFGRSRQLRPQQSPQKVCLLAFGANHQTNPRTDAQRVGPWGPLCVSNYHPLWVTGLSATA